MKKKVITVFTEGDANKLSTWSNVPYYLTNTLEKKGFIVNRINVGSSRIITLLFKKTITKLIRAFYNKESEYYLNRSLYFEKLVELKMRRAVRKYNDTDVFISTSFSYSPWKYTNAKKVLFCDWTIEYYYNYFLNREPDYFEQSSIKRQNTHIHQSDFVISLFPDVAKNMRNKYGSEKVSYLGNVINSELDIDKEEVLDKKSNSSSLLFIGGPKYLDGAKSLVKAFELLKLEYPDLKLNIIGLTQQEFDYLPLDVHCFGYMDKSNPGDKERYYNLMSEGKIIINTTPKWAAFSATVEAMYWFTPTITTPYKSFIDTFGESISFGHYCEKNDPDLIRSLIIKILDLSENEYKGLCIESNRAVQPFTWENYVEKILDTIGE